MNYDQATGALARLNIALPTLNEQALEEVVYGRGVPTQSLITMHKAAVALFRDRQSRHWARRLAVEASGALRLKALKGDSEARSYLAELSSK